MQLRGVYPKVMWKRLNYNSYGVVRWNFILFLSLHGKMYTMDILKKWKLIDDSMCPLCSSTEESIEHLFSSCQYSTIVWDLLLSWQGTTKKL